MFGPWSESFVRRKNYIIQILVVNCDSEYLVEKSHALTPESHYATHLSIDFVNEMMGKLNGV